MKKSIFTIAILLSIFSVTFTSCDKDEDDLAQDLKVSAFTLTVGGVTATEVVGEIMVCPDGYFGINGKTPDGNALAFTTGKIMVNETRSICTIMQKNDDFINCVDNGGFNIGGLFQMNHYSPISGTATRTSINDITVSGVLVNLVDLTEYAFTLEATASLVSPVNCE
jgi:hypothetical protein